jgi:hypothetical protein
MARHLEETAGLISRTDGTKDGALRSSSKGAKQGCKMYYVYLVRSASVPQQRYVGFTENLKQRIADHNAGQNPSTHGGGFSARKSVYSGTDDTPG